MQKQQVIATWSKTADLWETGEVDVFGHSVAWLETWPKSGMTRNGRLYERPMSERHIDVPESSFLPTPKASDSYLGSTARTTGRPIERSTHLGTRLALLSTPNTSDGSGGGQHPDKRKGHSRQLIG